MNGARIAWCVALAAALAACTTVYIAVGRDAGVEGATEVDVTRPPLAGGLLLQAIKKKKAEGAADAAADAPAPAP